MLCLRGFLLHVINGFIKMMNNQKGRVIITYGRSLMALSAAHSLGKHGIEVIACDDVDMTVTQFSKYVDEHFVHTPYEDDEERFIQDLEEHIIKFKPDDDRPYVLMPMFRDARVVAKHKERLEKHIKVATPDLDMICGVHPKDAFAKTCQRLGLNIPKTDQFETAEELEKEQERLKYPLLIKPVDEKGGHGISIVNSHDELCARYDEILTKYETPALVQELAEGDDYCLSVVCDHGEIIESMAYRNLYKFPRKSGAGIMRETVDDAPFLDDAKTLLSDLKWHGIAQIDFMWTGDNTHKPVLIELNPRFWAGLFHSVESGADFPWLLYQLTAYGKITDMDQIVLGKKTKIPGLWALSALQGIYEDDVQFDHMKTAWGNLWDIKQNTPFMDRLKNLKTAFDQDVPFDKIFSDFKHANEQGDDAVSELDFDDDHFAGMGFLFVISSLLRHGELPPELQ
jgi:predicted ATP-grasp superfamily ATP-dependent carboligase